jgi:hypothetical protein
MDRKAGSQIRYPTGQRNAGATEIAFNAAGKFE